MTAQWRTTFRVGVWDLVICSVRGHDWIEQPHDHDGYGSEDVRRCNQCRAVQVRDGCLARGCEVVP